ncbi:MAG TPA: DUF2085 domain-containing protein [Bryobacterales bacterium]|nr:DUF2085 domain-containing protein [Bryobacterales bacterium]
MWRGCSGNSIRWVAVTSPALVLLAAVSAPLLARAASPLSLGVYTAFSWACHQQPLRSWSLDGRPLAICVRCFGFYLGALVGGLIGHRFSRRLFLASTSLMGGEWLVETAIWPAVPGVIRFLTGLAVGFSLISILWTERVRPVLRMLKLGETAS